MNNQRTPNNCVAHPSPSCSIKTSSPSSAAGTISVEAVTMGTDWEAMLSTVSEGSVSVNTVTDKRHSISLSLQKSGHIFFHESTVCLFYACAHFLTWCSHLQRSGGDTPSSSVFIMSSQEKRRFIHSQTLRGNNQTGSEMWEPVWIHFTLKVFVYLHERPADPNLNVKLMFVAASPPEPQIWSWWANATPEESWGDEREEVRVLQTTQEKIKLCCKELYR